MHEQILNASFLLKKSAFIKFYFLINHKMIIHRRGEYHSKKFTSSRSNLKHQRQHTKETVTSGKYTSTFSLLLKYDDISTLSYKRLINAMGHGSAVASFPQ